jgi:two-component system chemotaxis response regulator CheB
VVVAPGDAHLQCVSIRSSGWSIRLSRARVASGCLPSVDPMLASVAACFGARALGVMLSGMGRDGEAGARLLAAAGGCVVAQDRATSAVWGMPGAVASFADAVLPPDQIGRLIAAGRRPAC